MIKNLEKACGLPVAFDTETSELILGEGLNNPSYCVRRLHDLKDVWANPIVEEDQVIYRYTSALHFQEDAPVWKKANVAYGIVIFVPGTFSGEYVKSSGQFHPPVQPCNMGTPEVYTVLSGVGHFLLQKASPPFEKIEDLWTPPDQPRSGAVGFLVCCNGWNEGLLRSLQATQGGHLL